MLLILSVYITNDRANNRYSRDEIFAYMLKSYKNIPFTEIYLFVLIDKKLLNPSKVIFDTRLNTDGSINKYKARLVAQGNF